MALDIKLLRSAIAQRDKERAERATLVAQEKLVGGGVQPPGVVTLRSVKPLRRSYLEGC